MDSRSAPSILGPLHPLLGPLRTCALALEGPSKYDGHHLRALYVGNLANVEFLQALFLREPTSEALATYAHPALAARSALGQRRSADFDLLLIDHPRLWAPFAGVRFDLQLPAWVRQEVVFQDESGAAAREILSRPIEREVARHLRRDRYEIDITRDQSAKLHFFRVLYRPYVESRFGAHAVVVSERMFLDRSEGRLLARLHAHGRWVAGMLLEQSKTRLRFGWYGAESNPPPSGASEVLDAYCIRYARDRGLRRVVFGNSRPNLRDGVVRYKRKFGARIVPTRFPQAVLGIKVLKWSDGLIRCFAEQPLIAQRGGRCYASRVQSSETGAPTFAFDPL